MDPNHFDAWARTLSSRRTALTSLVGGGLATLLGLPSVEEAGAEPKRCPRGKKTCGRRCIPKNRECCNRNQKQCGKKCIAKSKCCKDADCGNSSEFPEFSICAKGTCVTGQGTCAAGANACNGNGACGVAGSGCQCFQTKNPARTRCGDNDQLGSCGGCVNDADCATEYPRIPGVFCAEGFGTFCPCAAGGRFCMAPC